MSKTHFATRNFNDAGTGKRFAKGAAVTATAGEIENYKAAGLVTDEAPKADARPADDKKVG